MACGNNNIDRSYLNSQPTVAGAPAMARRIANQVEALPADRSGPLPKVDRDEQGREQYYSYYNRSAKRGPGKGEGEIQYFVDERGFPTTNTPHVHVIHDELKNEVRVLLSVEGVDRHPYPTITLPGAASGNEVNAAVDHFIRIMRDRAG